MIRHKTVLLLLVSLCWMQPVFAQEAILSNGGASDEERLIALTLTRACSGARGEIDYTDVVRADVSDDGLEDIVWMAHSMNRSCVEINVKGTGE